MSKGDDVIDVAFDPEGLEPDFGFEQSREFGSRMPEQDHQGLSRILFFFFCYIHYLLLLLDPAVESLAAGEIHQIRELLMVLNIVRDTAVYAERKQRITYLFRAAH